MTNKYFALAQDWFEQRTARERLLLGVLSACALLWVGVALIWQPLRQYRTDLVNKIALYDAGLTALENPAFAAGGAAAAIVDNRPVPVILTDSAATAQLVIRRLEAEGGGARVVLEEASFDQVILWLEALKREHGLSVSDLEMTRRPAPGVVTTTFALER
ncbi:type II secretion system protein GspM [Cypionkella psychrotolerans]|uniref:type II secretion system protein GspM n=1 Tax=Cypionkella psychrotolerans TaxID=1678131 RepID=UPI0006B6626B|nr:type II secretion system protein GspM [Cypionkella psychrotolerans]